MTEPSSGLGLLDFEAEDSLLAKMGLERYQKDRSPPMRLLSDDQLERSAAVANCRMNRERDLTGSNGYVKEVGFNPLEYLRERVAPGPAVSWLDLCCGTGKALIEAAEVSRSEGLDVQIVGVDLVGMFHRPDLDLTHLRLVESSLRTWRPDRDFDLITCVHGLHYVGDKLGLLARAASWLADDGLFLANLDLKNLKLTDGREGGRKIVSNLRRAGIAYDRSKRLLVCHGRKIVSLPYQYLGADDGGGQNYTGQPAVDSYYQPGAVHPT
jgi:SAM-dependent methyltransferase